MYNLYLCVKIISVILHSSKHISYLRFLKHNNCNTFDSKNKSSHSKHIFLADFGWKCAFHN